MLSALAKRRLGLNPFVRRLNALDMQKKTRVQVAIITVHVTCYDLDHFGILNSMLNVEVCVQCKKIKIIQCVCVSHYISWVHFHCDYFVMNI